MTVTQYAVPQEELSRPGTRNVPLDRPPRRPPLGRLGWLPNPSRRRGLAHLPPLLPPPPEDAAGLRPEADGGGGGSSSLPRLRGGGAPTCVEVRPI